MSELGNAAVKFPLALSSFGAQKLLGILPMGDRMRAKGPRQLISNGRHREERIQHEHGDVRRISIR